MIKKNNFISTVLALTLFAESALAGIGAGTAPHEYSITCQGKTLETQGDGIGLVDAIGMGDDTFFVTDFSGILTLSINRYQGENEKATVYLSVPRFWQNETEKLHDMFSNQQVGHISIYKTSSESFLIAASQSSIGEIENLTEADLNFSSFQVHDLNLFENSEGEIVSAQIKGKTSSGLKFATHANCKTQVF